MIFFRFLGNYIIRVFYIVLHILFFILFFRFFIVEVGLTDGQSMEPTLRDNKVFFVNKIGSLLLPPKRFDIIQHIHPLNHQKILVKRIIGLPGETVIFKLNSIFIRDKVGREFKLEETYLYQDIFIDMKLDSFNRIFVPENTYFVVGDNRLFSTDSRVYGPIRRSLILGKIIFIPDFPHKKISRVMESL